MKKITKKVLSGILLCGMLTAGVFGAQLVHAAVVSEPDANGVYYLTEGDELNLKIHPYGDINGDGELTTTDINFLRFKILGKKELSEYEKKVADANGDGELTTTDINFLRFAILGKKELQYD